MSQPILVTGAAGGSSLTRCALSKQRHRRLHNLIDVSRLLTPASLGSSCEFQSAPMRARHP